jgi:hypothetical protein
MIGTAFVLMLSAAHAPDQPDQWRPYRVESGAVVEFADRASCEKAGAEAADGGKAACVAMPSSDPKAVEARMAPYRRYFTDEGWAAFEKAVLVPSARAGR